MLVNWQWKIFAKILKVDDFDRKISFQFVQVFREKKVKHKKLIRRNRNNEIMKLH